MKKAAFLLSNHEQREFESVYQMFKSFPGWQMDNLFSEKTFESDECEKCSRVFSTSKKDKPNRLAVAAHESGHAIALIATYRSVGKAEIDLKNHPQGWLGFVEPYQYKDADDYQPIEQDGLPCEPILKMDILLKAGGFVGESFVGKKTGSNHEKFLVYCRCRFLDDRDGEKPLTNWDHYISWTKRIILSNEKLFWRIIDDLLENSELTDPVKILLHEKVIKEIPESLLN